MPKIPVIVALEPRSYREVVRSSLAFLRPHLATLAVAPEELATKYKYHALPLLLLTRPVSVVQQRAFAWVLLDPDPDRAGEAIVCIAGRRRMVTISDFSELLAVIDECVLAYRLARPQRLSLPRPSLAQAPQRVARLRTTARRYRAEFAPWQYVHMLMLIVIVPLGLQLLSEQVRGDGIGMERSAGILVVVAGIAMIEARQYRRTHGR